MQMSMFNSNGRRTVRMARIAVGIKRICKELEIEFVQTVLLTSVNIDSLLILQANNKIESKAPGCCSSCTYNKNSYNKRSTKLFKCLLS